MVEQEKKKNYGKTNKRKGSDAERYYARKFQDMGFLHCKTARLGSKLHDDAGIDLIFLPFNPQIKCGKQTGLNASKELKNIEDKMAILFPPSSPEQTAPKILIHKKQVGSGKRRTEYDEIVSMSFKDFTQLISKIKEW